MNVDLPAPFGPATTTRAGPSAAAARSDANGGTLTTWNERAPFEPPARPAAVRRDLDHALGILGVGAIDRRSRRADVRLDGLAVRIVHDPCQHILDLLGGDVWGNREAFAGALERQQLSMAGHHLDGAAQGGPVLDLRGDRAVRALRFRLGALEEPVRDLHRCRHGSRLLPLPGRRQRRLRAARSPAT